MSASSQLFDSNPPPAPDSSHRVRGGHTYQPVANPKPRASNGKGGGQQSVYFEPSIKARVRQAMEETGMSFSHIVNLCTSMYLPKLVQAYKDGELTASDGDGQDYSAHTIED